MLSERTLTVLNAGLCPDCAAPDATLAPGPRGGLGQNAACRKCGAEFNLVRPQLDHGVPKGPIIMAHRNGARGGPNRQRLASVFAITLPPADDATAARERAARAYFDRSWGKRACDHCGEFYTGPAVYCSLHCTLEAAD